MKRAQSGFTILELIFAIVAVGAACAIFFVQYHNLSISSRDDQRKAAINAMYYGLEKVYYPDHGYYPVTINNSVLPSVDPNLFTDPSGKKLGTSGSDYSYKATNCTNNECKAYTLQANLQGEATYVKTNTH